MKHTLRFFLSFTLLLSGILSFAGEKTKDNLACPTATISYLGNSFCVSEPNPQPVTLTGTDAYLGGIYSAMPLGLNINPNTGEIIPSTSAPGTYTVSYTIPAGGSCGPVITTTTITISPINTVSVASSSPTVCINVPITAITHTTTGATGIGTATGLPTGLTAAWSGDTATISGTPTVAGVFNYTFPLTGGCGTNYATGTITVSPSNMVTAASSFQTLCVNTALMTITHNTTGATGIGTATGLPAGVTASWAANTIAIAGTPTTAGVYNYTVPLTGGCGTFNATGTIVVIANNTVSVASSTPTLCINTLLTPITHTTIGATGMGLPTGLPTGVTASWSGNTITISGAPTTDFGSPYNYSIPLTGGCGTVNATGTITVTMASYAGTDGEIYECENNSTIDLFDIISGEQTGGTWTRTSGSGGTFNAAAGTFIPTFGATSSSFIYTVPATSTCAADSSIATINISIPPIGISISGNTSTCAGTPVNLTVTGTPGTVINWTGTPNYFTIGGSGNYILMVTPVETTTYTLISASLNTCSIPLTQSTTVFVSPTPQFMTQIPDITICNGETLDIASQLVSTIPGTTFVWTATTSNVNMSAISGDETNIDQLVNLIDMYSSGVITIEVMPHIGNCNGTSQQILVTVRTIPEITSTIADETTICNYQYVPISVNSNSSTTAFNWQVNQLATTGVQLAGGTISGTSVNGVINVQFQLTNSLLAGTISFDITPVNGICTGSTVYNAITFTVNPIPGTPLGLPTMEICSGEAANLFIATFPNTAGTTLEWTVTDSQNVSGFSNGTGVSPLSINDVLYNTSNVQGYVKYSVTTKLGNCEGGTTDYIVNINPLPNPVLTDGSICIDATTGAPYQGYLLDTQISNLDFTFDWYLLNTITSMYDQIVGASASTYEANVAGSYQVIVTNIVTNCINQASAYVTETFPATGISTTVSEASNPTITVTVNPIGTGNLIYALDNGDWQESNVFTGVEPGSHTVLVSDLEGCTNLSAVVVVNEILTDLVMFPNPSFDNINFSYNNKVMSVQISNQMGQTVLYKDLNTKTGTIDLSDLNMGIYNIVFETESGIVNQRIIKQ